LREIGRLYMPVLLGLIVSAVVVVIDRNLAWRAETDAIGAMRYATTLVQLILGLVVAAVSLAVLPQLSYQHANASEDAFREKLSEALRTITVLLAPAVVGMAVLAKPIVQLLFEHGETGPASSKLIVAALLLYLPGHLLAGYDQVLIFAFYARKQTLLPVLVGVVASLGYLIAAFALFDRFQMRGLVVANTAQFALHTLLMLWFGRSMVGRHGFRSLGSTLWRAAVASGAMGATAWLVWAAVDRTTGAGVTGELISVIVPVTAGVVVYGVITRVLGIDELDQVLGTLRRRIGALRG
ncbi:MAG: polysaccharide biosynthesis protein, partial [Thermomicrobiales bacterium]|nr:polysaccharide biosynthesis protein [Thermomicrobiales bacterium]